MAHHQAGGLADAERVARNNALGKAASNLVAASFNARVVTELHAAMERRYLSEQAGIGNGGTAAHNAGSPHRFHAGEKPFVQKRLNDRRVLG
jgi:hypothetical protein